MIEKPSALTNLEDIVHLSDVIMVARGDLGEELVPEDVPSARKGIIRCAWKSRRPVMAAT
jgi:pyruvate kinase